MRPGPRLGVDVGSVRVGVACSDPAGLLATPVATVRRGRGDLDRVVALAEERQVTEVLVGLPRTLAGREGTAAAAAEEFAQRLAGALPAVPVRLVDERLSTVVAQRDLRASGVGSRRGRSVVDQAAAVGILQAALDEERATGRAPGRRVRGTPSENDDGADDAKAEE